MQIERAVPSGNVQLNIAKGEALLASALDSPGLLRSQRFHTHLLYSRQVKKAIDWPLKISRAECYGTARLDAIF